ncbi:MAG TPA: four helix bundle protein [Terriglobales bacterium]|nr:four helix bundle protein [Terriglobales bacterium]
MEQALRGYRDLSAWQQAMAMVTEIYRITRAFPKEELYGLVSQIRRAAVSIPSNLAEGHGRNSRNEFRQFIGQARGSLSEVETQLEISKNLGYVKADVADALMAQADAVGKMLTGLRSWSEKAAG